MKKLTSFIATLALLLSAVPVTSFAESSDSATVKIISGDINSDNEVTVADMVTMQKYLLGSIDLAPQQYVNADINSDDMVNIFDFVSMRKIITGALQPNTRTYSFDVLKSVDSINTNYNDDNNVFTDYEKFESYISNLLADENEVNKYLERYNEEFFENYALNAQPIFRQFGDGIIPQYIYTYYKNDSIANIYAYTLDENADFSDYGENILAQAILTKEDVEKAEKGALWIGGDGSFLQQSKTFYSEDKETAVYAVDDIIIFYADTTIYFKQSDGTYKFIADLGETLSSEVETVFNEDSFDVTYKALDDNGLIKTLTIDYDGNILSKKAVDEGGNPADFENNALIFSSPDGERSIYVKQDSFLLGCSADIYMKDENGELQFVYSCGLDDGYTPFNGLGEWSEDEEGNPILSDNDNFSITWKTDSISINHSIEGYAQWTYVEISNDGEVIESYTYDK